MPVSEHNLFSAAISACGDNIIPKADGIRFTDT